MRLRLMQQRLTRFTAPYAFVLLAGVMLVAETPVCRAGDAAPADVRLQKFDFGDRVRAVVDRHMLPRIEAVNSASEALSKSIMRACKAQDAKSWSDARQDFAQTISAWAALSHLRFGPFAKDERARRVSFWPDPRSVVWRQMRKVRRDKNGELLLPGALAHKSVAIQGLTALEWLIPKGDKIESKPPYPGDYDCSFAVAIASNVSSIVKSIRDDLTGAHSWRQKWTSQARDPSGIRLDQIAMTDLVRSALLGLQLIREHQVVVIAVYELIPEYTGRPWKTSRIFALAWTAVLLFVMAVYPHHLLQDTVMPGWALVMGQVISYLSGIPLLAVTAFSLCLYLRGSNIKWDLASALLVLGVAGWSVGSVPAIIDGMISVNKVMHNTQWVPGHFHIYLILGEIAMSFGFMAWLAKDARQTGFTGLDRLAFSSYLLGGAGFTIMFLVSGALSVPRRWAVHAPEWFLQDRIATAFGALVVIGSLVFVLAYIRGLMQRATG